MGWNTHPDTLAVAAATGAANRSGHPPQSIGWLRAYRESYAKEYDYGDGSLQRVLADLDEEIGKFES